MDVVSHNLPSTKGRKKVSRGKKEVAPVGASKEIEREKTAPKLTRPDLGAGRNLNSFTLNRDK